MSCSQTATLGAGDGDGVGPGLVGVPTGPSVARVGTAVREAVGLAACVAEGGTCVSDLVETAVGVAEGERGVAVGRRVGGLAAVLLGVGESVRRDRTVPGRAVRVAETACAIAASAPGSGFAGLDGQHAATSTSAMAHAPRPTRDAARLRSGELHIDVEEVPKHGRG